MAEILSHSHIAAVMTSQNESVLLDFQKMLEHNEDILAAIVENLQLGRMEDCISHYRILQSNLFSLGTVLSTLCKSWIAFSSKEITSNAFITVVMIF